MAMDRFEDNLVGYLGNTDQVMKFEVREYEDRSGIQLTDLKETPETLRCFPPDNTCCEENINPSRWTGSPRSGARTS